MGQIEIPDDFMEAAIVFSPMSALGSAPTLLWGMGLAPGFDLANLGGIADSVQDLISPIDSSYSVDHVTFRLGDNAGPPYVSFDAFPAGVTGTATGSSQTPQVAALIKKSTLTPGRSGKGRCYLPGVPEGAVDDQGVLDSTFQLDVETAIATWQTTLAGFDVQTLVLFHPLGSALGPTPSEIIAFACAANVATQKRRQRN